MTPTPDVFPALDRRPETPRDRRTGLVADLTMAPPTGPHRHQGCRWCGRHESRGAAIAGITPDRTGYLCDLCWRDAYLGGAR